MLLRLKQGSVTAETEELGRRAVFTGPLVKEVLAAVGAARAKVSFIGINGYEGWLEPGDVEASDWILALDVDGAPLGLGQQGPAWINQLTRARRRTQPIASWPLGVGRVLYARRRLNEGINDQSGAGGDRRFGSL
jgi:hypothetical protein